MALSVITFTVHRYPRYSQKHRTELNCFGCGSSAWPRLPTGCYSRPALAALQNMSLDEQRAVEGLVIGKQGE